MPETGGSTAADADGDHGGNITVNQLGLGAMRITGPRPWAVNR